MPFITYEDVKVELKMKKHEVDNEELINAVTESVLSMLDVETGRTWASGERTEYFNGDGITDKFNLINYPITAITNVWCDVDREYSSDDIVDAQDYTYDSGNGILYIDYPLCKGFNNIKVLYTAGYTDITIPDYHKQLLIRQSAHWYVQAIDRRWDMSSKSLPAGGGTINYNTLKGNLLPEFELFLGRNKT